MISDRQKVHELIHTSPVATDPSSLLWKLKTAYDSCMHVDEIRTDAELKSDFGSKLGSNVFSGYFIVVIVLSTFKANYSFEMVPIYVTGRRDLLSDFSVSTWNLKKFFTVLYSQFNVSPFFIIDVVPDVTDSPKHIIRVND